MRAMQSEYDTKYAEIQARVDKEKEQREREQREKELAKKQAKDPKKPQAAAPTEPTPVTQEDTAPVIQVATVASTPAVTRVERPKSRGKNDAQKIVRKNMRELPQPHMCQSCVYEGANTELYEDCIRFFPSDGSIMTLKSQTNLEKSMLLFVL